jgi:hypothetical protein
MMALALPQGALLARLGKLLLLLLLLLLLPQLLPEQHVYHAVRRTHLHQTYQCPGRT